MNKINKYRYLNILFLAILLIAFSISCDDGSNLNLDQQGPVVTDNPSEHKTKEDTPSGDLLENDTECIYMQTHTEKINFKIEGTENLANREYLKEVELYFPLSSAKVKGEDLKYNLYMGLSNFKSDLVSDKNRNRPSQAWECGKTIEIGSHKYNPFLDDHWRFFTERPSVCYDVNEKFEILIKNYKSKNCTYEVIYNK